MMKLKRMLALTAAMCMLLISILTVGCGTVKSSLRVEKVKGMDEDFILGMDASAVPSLEAGGVRYFDRDGTERDVFDILSRYGINYIRVRVWNDPFDADGNGYGGGNCDIENAVNIGRRAAKYGMKLLVDFHYSDFWADPSKQMPPKAWEGMDIGAKSHALYEYTKASLSKLIEAGARIGMVQIGNETNGAFCGERANDKNIAALMSSGAKAVREVCPEALVVLHFTNPEKAEAFSGYAAMLAEHAVDYDVFASSYYPYWHGTMDNLSQLLSNIAEKYGKKVMIAETSYAFTAEDTDFYRNTIGEGDECGYPMTVQGQADFLRDLVDTAVNKTKNCIGVFYWEGTWIAAGGKSYDENRILWEKYGSGWATSHAAEYDPEDAGKWYGGCAVDNQAFFDSRGKATEAITVFAILKRGNDPHK